MDDVQELEEILSKKPTAAERYFSRFFKLLEFNNDLAVILIKSWLQKSNYLNNLALQAIGQHLEEEKMAQLFEKLSLIERQKWKENIKNHLSSDALKEASIYISEEITRELLSNNANYDVEFFDLIANCTTEHLINFLKKHPEQVASAFNLFPPNLLAKILNEVSKEEATHYIEQSFHQSVDKNEKAYLDLKNKLKNFLGEIKGKPFTSKLLEMLPRFNPFKENVIYESLFQTVSKKEIVEVARKNFPYALFTSLPSDIIRGALKSYPEKERLHFLSSLDEEDRNFYIEAFAAFGTPLRDMIELGLSEIENNSAQKRQLESSKQEIAKRFIKHLREFLHSNPSFAPSVYEIVETWAQQHTQKPENVINFPHR